jgi:hypothetical protein
MVKERPSHVLVTDNYPSVHRRITNRIQKNDTIAVSDLNVLEPLWHCGALVCHHSV